MIRQDMFELQFADGHVETVSVDGRDYLAYERETGGSALALDLTGEGATFAAWWAVAGAAMRRQGRFTGTPADFEEAVAYVLPKATPEEAPDPTTPPEAGESSS